MHEWAPGERERHLAEIDEQGFTILEGVVPDDLRLDLTERIDRAMAEAGTGLGTNVFLGRHTRRLFNLLARDPAFARVPLFEPTLSLAEGVLDEGLLLSSLTAISMGPGQEPQPFHADDGSIGLPRPHLPITCLAIWALTDFTAENGGTRIVPGSHRYDHIPGKGEVTDGWVQAEMPAGSVLVYDGSVWHREQPLRGLDPPGGEPAAGPRPRLRRAAAAAPAADGGLLGVPGPHGPRRPDRPGHVARPGAPQRDGLGPHPLRRRPAASGPARA